MKWKDILKENVFETSREVRHQLRDLPDLEADFLHTVQTHLFPVSISEVLFFWNRIRKKESKRIPNGF